MKTVPYEPFKRVEPPPKPPQIRFADLVAGRDRIIWGYFGLCPEYHIIMDWLKESIPVNVFIANTREEFDSAGDEWLDKREFKTSPTKPHSIDDYLTGIALPKVNTVKKFGIGLIIAKGLFPAGELNSQQMKAAVSFVTRLGLSPVVANDEPELVDKAGAVAGVESACLWLAARNGLPVAMPERSVGYDLLKKLTEVAVLK